MFPCDEQFLKEERKQEELIGRLEVEHMGHNHMKDFHEACEKSLHVQIAEPEDKVLEKELYNDYLSS